jgi:hypothetical protein
LKRFSLLRHYIAGLAHAALQEISMRVAEWQSFVVAIQERKLPKIGSLSTVQAQLYRLYKERTITPAQWSEFQADLHQLEPALPWLG